VALDNLFGSVQRPSWTKSENSLAVSHFSSTNPRVNTPPSGGAELFWPSKACLSSVETSANWRTFRFLRELVWLAHPRPAKRSGQGWPHAVSSRGGAAPAPIICIQVRVWGTLS
jgi:hypothetical protein